MNPAIQSIEQICRLGMEIRIRGEDGQVEAVLITQDGEVRKTGRNVESVLRALAMDVQAKAMAEL